MTTEAKTSVEEKRVKSTIIRRRAKAEEAPAPEPEVEAAPSAPAPVETPEAQAPASARPLVIEEKEAEKKPVVPAVPVRVPQMPKMPEIRVVSPFAPMVRPAAPKPAATPGGIVTPKPLSAAAAEAAEKARKLSTRRKSRDELEMEMIDRAGGIKRAADLMESAPERLERVFRPEKNSKKKKVFAKKDFKKTEITTPKAIKRIVRIEGVISVGDLAHRMSIKATDVVKKLMGMGMMATVNHKLDLDTATLVATDFGYEVENVAFQESTLLDKIVGEDQKAEAAAEQVKRPPIVTVMGHVDHGKTSLLDALRKAQVAAGEAGGITQHIGAYEVQTPKGSITFIDTPGHEAFTAMRARGAQVTDIVILVVAGDDGVMPQTIEAINHAKAAKVPIVVAVNKMDKPEADLGRIERGLMEYSLVSEKLGGDTIIVPVSAKTGMGLPELLEMVLLQSEVLELKASVTKRGVGSIIEARLDKGRGPVATVVIQEGTLKVGDIIVAGLASGKVRALLDHQGNPVKEAGPSKPVEVLGMSSVPMAGDKLHAMDSEEDARQVSEYRGQKAREAKQQVQAPARLEEFFANTKKGELPEVRVVVKGDVQGSVEAIREALVKLTTEKVKVVVIHTGVGAVNESDVMLAVASRAIVVGFNVRPDNKAREISEREKIQVRSYSIIYEVIDDLKKAMVGKLAPTYEEKYLGRAEVRQAFTISKVGTIAGCSVTDGKILRSATVRLLRDNKIVTQGKISSLKRFKDDVREVSTSMECGIAIENYNDIKPGDVIEAFQVEEIAATL